MAKVKAGKVELEYEYFWQDTNPVVVLVAGSGAQMGFWETKFCEMLAEKGFYVLRFDNRDAGLSTKFDKVADRCPYTLEDMADDVSGLLDALGIETAHICGASMGGMIAQIFACRYPLKALALTSIMSSTGNPELPVISEEALKMVTEVPPSDREGYIAHTAAMWRALWSKGFPFEEERARRYIEESFDRCYYPLGAVHHNMAVADAGDRRAELAKLNIPTLVIHGTADPMFPVEAGMDTAAVIPNAELLLIEGMGHDMPIGTWEQIVDGITENAGRLYTERKDYD